MKALRFVTPFLILVSLFVGLFAQSPQTSFASVKAAASAVSPVGGPAGTNWTQTFGDDFTGTSVNRAAWRSDYFPNGGNGEMQQYVSDNSHNSYIEQNGMLQIVGRKESLNGQSYTSGIIHTKGLFEQKYGYFEMRAKVPAGKGYWPAFWLLPDQDNWVPEIDVMEILCDKPNVDYMTYHYNASSGAYTQTQSTYSGTNFSVGWHTFAVDWEPSAMVWYVDGVEQKRVSDASIIPAMPMYLIANLAIGGNWPGSPDSSTVFPSTLDIDYIRAWQKSAGSPPTATPTKPAVTATPTKPAVTATPTSLPPVSGANLISNASFETWNTPWAFRNDLSATFSQDTSTAANGTHASFKASLPSSSSSQPWVVSLNQSNKSLTAGQPYTLSFWAKASASRPIRAVIQGQNSPYTAYTTQTANLTTAWTRYTFTFTAPTSTTTAMLNFNLADATGSVWIDEVSLMHAGQAATATQIFVPTITKTVAATITLVASSVPTKAPTATSVPAANLISNASFESGSSPWNTPWTFRNDLGAAFSQDTSTAANGTHASFKVSLTKSSSSQPWVVSLNQSGKSLSAGKSYTLSFWAKASASRPIRAVIQSQNSPYTAYTTQTANLTTAWTRYTFTFTAPTSTTTAMLNFNLADATGSVWIDEVNLH